MMPRGLPFHGIGKSQPPANGRGIRNAFRIVLQVGSPRLTSGGSVMPRSTRMVALGLVAGCAWAVAWAAPAPPDADEKVKDRAAFLPQRKYQPLPGKVVGVVVSDVAKVMAHDGRGG